MKCNVCGKRFTPKAENRYLATKTKSIAEAFSGVEDVFECFDCIRCGCQIVAQPRLAKFTPNIKVDTEAE